MKKEAGRYNYNTTKERLKRLKIKAVEEDRSMNSILDELIDKYLEGDKNEQ